jgi:hypothetical protein
LARRIEQEHQMTAQRLVVALTAANLIILVVSLGKVAPSTAQAEGTSVEQQSSRDQAVVPVLRGRALELLDDRGQVRSRINVEPNGDVVLRLLDKNGTIRVKLGASENGSGLVLLDKATEPGVHIKAGRNAEGASTTSLTLRGTGGQERVIKP